MFPQEHYINFSPTHKSSIAVAILHRKDSPLFLNNEIKSKLFLLTPMFLTIQTNLEIHFLVIFCRKVCVINDYSYLCSNRTRLHPIRTASESFLYIDI